MVSGEGKSSGHFMPWEDFKNETFQALTMGKASYSKFSNSIYIYSYLKNTHG